MFLIEFGQNKNSAPIPFFTDENSEQELYYTKTLIP